MLKLHTFDCGNYEIDFDPEAHHTLEEAAKAFHKAICAANLTDEKYIYVWSPEETADRGYGYCWSVCWEEGPYSWASTNFISGPWGYCEAYNSFILCFVR